MDRVKIKFPDENPLFTAIIPVRIGDINYGGHVGNDAVLSVMHEARMQLLAKWDFTELEAGDNSLIMADVMIAYRGEAFYGDVLSVSMYVQNITERTFDLLYRLTTTRDGQIKEIAHAKTGMTCFDYTTRKIAVITDLLKSKLKTQ